MIANSEEPELNYNIPMAPKCDWVWYFGEYQYAVNVLLGRIKGGEITVVSLPLAFLVRHTLELGYKMNLIELNKIADNAATISYTGKSAHRIDTLHAEFVRLMFDLFKKYKVDQTVIDQFNEYNESLERLNKAIHKLDEFSYAFRYPVGNDGVTSSFISPTSGDEVEINFKEIKELYDKAVVLLKYSTDVIAEYVPS